MVSKTMMTVLLGINPNDPDIQKYIQAADDIVNSILSLPVNMPGFKFRKVIHQQRQQSVKYVRFHKSRRVAKMQSIISKRVYFKV